MVCGNNHQTLFSADAKSSSWSWLAKRCSSIHWVLFAVDPFAHYSAEALLQHDFLSWLAIITIIAVHQVSIICFSAMANYYHCSLIINSENTVAIMGHDEVWWLIRSAARWVCTFKCTVSIINIAVLWP